ncbi:MAG: glycosyltransferase, partial [Pseudomonadota bacterium]
MVVVRILLCTRNGEAFLDAQLASYLDQTHADWRLWISDDGSTDATLQIIARFAQDHPHRVERILPGPQAGSTRNFLSLLCHPDLEPGFVALSDQDDIWREDKLERAVSALSRGETNTARAYAAGYLVCDARMQRSSASASWPRTPSLGNAILQNVMPGHTIVLNPAALASLRLAGVQDVPYQDWWIYLVATACGMQVILDPEHVIQYRQHGA